MEIIEYIDQIDKQFFLFLNGFHTPLSDWVMVLFTEKQTWIPFYVLLIIYFFWKFKWQGLLPIAGILLTILFADQFSSGFCKPFFERLRPCHQPEIQALVHTTIKGCGGKYGFISSHAANSFGIATFIFLFFKDKWKYTGWVFLWSALVSYSRIAVGVHYPADILFGGLSGILFGHISYLIFQTIIKKYSFQFQ